VKDKLADDSKEQNSLKMEQERVVRRITAKEFATTFQGWYERCIEIVRGYVKNG
jgi:hypothetical protein